jgi:hypothetical protein
MSRTGSFPLPVAFELLAKYSTKGMSVFDPFCGKGTALLAARVLGLSAYGMDIAPEAVICTSAKLGGLDLSLLIEYIDALPRRSQADPASVPPAVKVFFHPVTLSELLAVRKQLIEDRGADQRPVRECATATLALLLGILHGHASYSLSISSAHAYAMAPAYVERYAERNGLKPPLRHVKECLLAKAARCIPDRALPRVRWSVSRGCVMDAHLLFRMLRNKIDIILTSPPYLNAQTYSKDNWLRQWLLGYDHRALHTAYLETGSVPRYEAQMLTALSIMFRMLRPGGRLICVAGDVRLRNNTPGVYKTGRRLAELAALPAVGFNVEEEETHRVASLKRYYHALNDTNGHSSRDLIERVFVASKGVDL